MNSGYFKLLILVGICVGLPGTQGFERPVWGYECVNNICRKAVVTNDNAHTLQGFDLCRLTCNNFGTLWPFPTGPNVHSTQTEQLDITGIFITSDLYVDWVFWSESTARFKKLVNDKTPNIALTPGGRPLSVQVNLGTNDLTLSIDTPEDYTLTTQVRDIDVRVEITARTFYGARHGLETLAQLIVYDEMDNKMKINMNVKITDAPVFKHRGLMLDTARNFVTKEGIKRTIEGLAMVKMNTFHWHITDSQSFPAVIKSQPMLSKFGAYSPDKVYTAEDIKEIVLFAKIRGVRVIPEIDAPAHVGEGWEQKGLITCFNIQPWASYCVEPPCGQFDVSQDQLYDALEDVYREIVENFGNFDVFHMGGDEVSLECWNTSTNLQNWIRQSGWNIDERGFMNAWAYFQDNALARFDKVAKKKMPIILWTSSLTEKPFLTEHLDKDRYIIQIWTLGDDPKVQMILREGYKMIVSNYDALYLDCGFGHWVTDGNNWCSPYIGWQKVYDNKMETIAGDYISQILGAEAALWTEQADDENLDSRIWPRVSALAERLWTNPSQSWRQADSRMLMNRRRLVRNSVGADRLQPEWCLQNEGECPL